MFCHFVSTEHAQMRRREQEEVDKERQREVQDRKEAASLAKHERMGIQSLASKWENGEERGESGG